MKLVFPRVGVLDAADSNLLRLARFLGGECEELPLPPYAVDSNPSLENSFSKETCLVVNPDTFAKWLKGQALPVSLVASLICQVRFVLVHNLRDGGFAEDVLHAFSDSQLQSTQIVPSPAGNYEISSQTKEICGAFSGLTFGPSNPSTDSVFSGPGIGTVIMSHISIDGKPLLASKKSDATEIFFFAGGSVADLGANVWETPLSEFFSQVVPPAMALRYIFAEECWQPNAPLATLIIDDPLLRKDYGFVNFKRLLALTDKHNFHTCIAFIPYNCHRSSSATAQLFRERPDRLSICFHGNDHTDAELAAKDPTVVNAMLDDAERRMLSHEEKTSITCDSVMVFPQGNFSGTAMKVLKARNFCGAVNTKVDSMGEPAQLTLAEAISPSVLKYDGFPLFLRKYVRTIGSEDIAFNVFFGRPVFIVEHHAIFKTPKVLTDLVDRINQLVPDIKWTNLQTALENSSLKRRAPDGSFNIRAYSNACKISNSARVPMEGSLEWAGQGDFCSESSVAKGPKVSSCQVGERAAAIPFTLGPGESRKFSLECRNEFGLSRISRGLSWKVKAIVRRRLSEFRDNHLSKNPQVLAFAETLKRRLSKGAQSTPPSPLD